MSELDYPNCKYCNYPQALPHQREGHRCTAMMESEIEKQKIIIDLLLLLLDKANAKFLYLQAEHEILKKETHETKLKLLELAGKQFLNDAKRTIAETLPDLGYTSSPNDSEYRLPTSEDHIK